MMIIDGIHQTAAGVWVVTQDDYICGWIDRLGRLDFDQLLLPQVLPFIPSGGVVVDAGAFVGDQTIAYLDKAGPDGKVFAFEPNYLPYVCLERNCPGSINIMAALGARCGTAQYSDAVGNLGAGMVVPDAVGGRPVPVIPLDAFSLDRLDFMKLDVEGAETSVIRGAVRTIASHRPVMCIEVNEQHLIRQGSSRAELFNVLDDLCYRLFNLDDCGWDGGHYDCLAIPREFQGEIGPEISIDALASMVNEARNRR